MCLTSFRHGMMTETCGTVCIGPRLGSEYRFSFVRGEVANHRPELSIARARNQLYLFQNHAHRPHSRLQTLDQRSPVRTSESADRHVADPHGVQRLLYDLRLPKRQPSLEDGVEASDPP